MTKPPHKDTRTPERPWAAGVFIAASVVLLFLGFYRNQWNVVREKKFKEFQQDSESLVIARMVELRQYGLLAQNGLLGWGDVNPKDLNQVDYDHQYDIFLSAGRFSSYSLYKSTSGLQGLAFNAMHGASPFTPATDLRNFRAGVALLLALVLGAFIAWGFQEFGWITAATLLLHDPGVAVDHIVRTQPLLLHLGLVPTAGPHCWLPRLDFSAP